MAAAVGRVVAVGARGAALAAAAFQGVVAAQAAAAHRGAGDMFSEKDKQAIETLIGEIEKQSALEFVVVEVARSGAYGRYRALGVAALTLTLAALTHWIWPQLSTSWVILLQVPFAFVAWFVCATRWVLLALTPDAYEAAKVHQMAEQVFLEREVFNTKDRTGVLILFSNFERRVTIMVDRAAFAALGEATLSEQIRLLTQSLKQHQPIEGLRTVMNNISTHVAGALPRSFASPANQLANQVE